MLENKFALPLTVLMAAACHGESPIRDPQTVTIEIAPPAEPLVVLKEEKPLRPKRVEKISKETREMLRANCYWSFAEPYHSCSKSELDLFFQMAKKLPPQVNAACKEDGDYKPNCVEDAYQAQFGEDQLCLTLQETKKRCEGFMEQCVAKKIATCKGSVPDCAERERKALLKPNRRFR